MNEIECLVLRGPPDPLQGGLIEAFHHDLFHASYIFRIAADLDLTLVFLENRQAIDQFSTTGLYELPTMIAAVDLVVRTVKRISAEIAQDPAQYFLQDRQSGYQIPPVTRSGR